jgi:hypothetical protein
MPDLRSDAPPTTKFLRCPVCGRLIAHHETDLVPLIAGGWPTCCGQPMALYVDARPPNDPGGG